MGYDTLTRAFELKIYIRVLLLKLRGVHFFVSHLDFFKFHKRRKDRNFAQIHDFQKRKFHLLKTVAVSTREIKYRAGNNLGWCDTNMTWSLTADGSTEGRGSLLIFTLNFRHQLFQFFLKPKIL